MTVAKKFLFENDFDDPMPIKEKASAAQLVNKQASVSVPEPVIEPEAPSFSEEELIAACEQARKIGDQEGHKRGVIEGQQRLEAQIAAAFCRTRFPLLCELFLFPFASFQPARAQEPVWFSIR